MNDLALQAELDYLLYRDAREGHEDRKAIVAWFGFDRAAKLEARYQSELLERKANDAREELRGTLAACGR